MAFSFKIKRIPADSDEALNKAKTRATKSIYTFLAKTNDPHELRTKWTAVVRASQSKCESNSAAKLVALTDSKVVGTRKVVIVSSFLNPLRAIHKQFPESHLICGELTIAKRKSAFDAFADEKKGVLLLSKTITSRWELPKNCLLIFWQVGWTDEQDQKLIRHLKPAEVVQYMATYVDNYLWKRRYKKRTQVLTIPRKPCRKRKRQQPDVPTAPKKKTTRIEIKSGRPAAIKLLLAMFPDVYYVSKPNKFLLIYLFLYTSMCLEMVHCVRVMRFLFD
jgi:hypothetical protein